MTSPEEYWMRVGGILVGGGMIGGGLVRMLCRLVVVLGSKG